MLSLSPLRVAAVACAVALGGFASLDIAPTGSSGSARLSLGAPTAHAHHVVARRGVARRTTRRIVRRNVARAHYRASVVGCPYRAPYYYCGGYYYSPVIRDGRTVYIAVEKDVTIED